MIRKSLAYAIHADRIDPLVVMANTRLAVGREPFYSLRREAYKSARLRSAARCFGLTHAENLYRDSILAPAVRRLGGAK